MTPLSQMNAHSAVPASLDRPKTIAGAAEQFESLMIQQMLQLAREGGVGDELGGQSGSALSEMAEQQFAQMMAANGGIGLAKMVAAGLERK